jgi:GDPmannose 4,6-dehydratase
LFLHYADLDDTTTLRRLLVKIVPNEFYHLAGQSHVGLSFDIPESTLQTTALATLRLLEIMRDLPAPPRFYHASSSEIFGRPQTWPQNEETPLSPVTPYGCGKSFATQIVRVYRESFGLFASNGIMFNHESSRRGENFVTRKICRAAAAIKLGLQSELVLGDLAAQRDWGHAREYVHGMWLSLQHPSPEDFVFATGESHSVQEVAECAFSTVGLDWRDHIQQDARLLRPSEPTPLVGNPAKAQRLLGWQTRVSFEQLIGEMTRAEHESMAQANPVKLSETPSQQYARIETVDFNPARRIVIPFPGQPAP